MDITPFVEQLRRDLQSTADVGGDASREAASRLLVALDPSARLALMDALSQAAAEITAELPSGAVETRLVGRDLEFVVDVSHVAPTPPSPPVPPLPEAEDSGTARVTLRLPEPVKKRAEDLAAQGGLSLNNWLVGVVRQATVVGTDAGPPGATWPGSPRGKNHLSGWL